MADHPEHGVNAPVDHRLDHDVSDGGLVLRRHLHAHIDAVVAQLEWEAGRLILKAR